MTSFRTPFQSNLPRIRAPDKPKGLRFQSRGQHRCVQADGRNQTGVHHALTKALYPEWDYDTAKRQGRLIRLPPVASQFFLATPTNAIRRRMPPSSATQGGCKLDTQMTTTVKLTTGPWNVPGSVFFDRTVLNSFIADNMSSGVLAQRAATRLRTTCRNLIPETIHAWRALHSFGLEPLSTQDVVAHRGVGTRVDLVARDRAGLVRVIEMKRGCSTAFGNGRMMRAPFTTRTVSTHDHYVLQTLVNHKLYHATHPSMRLGLPLLLRIDSIGAHLYTPPPWAVASLPALMDVLFRWHTTQ